MTINIESLLMKLHENNEEIHRELTEIKIILARQDEKFSVQSEQLQEHMARSKANEELLKITREEIAPLKKERPWKIVGVTAVIVAFIAGIVQVMEFLSLHLHP